MGANPSQCAPPDPVERGTGRPLRLTPKKHIELEVPLGGGAVQETPRGPSFSSGVTAMWRDTQGYNEELFRILGVRNVISVGLDFKGKRFPTATVIMELTEEQQRQIEELNSGPRARIEKGEISELSTKIALTAVTALQKHGYDAFGGSYQDISKPVFRAIRKAAEEALASLDND